MKKSNELSVFRIQTRNIWAFMEVAKTARQRQIVKFGEAAVLACNDVF